MSESSATQCQCGSPWVYRAPWWARNDSREEMTWGYLVHCERAHFFWYAAPLSYDEMAVARASYESHR